MRTANRVDWKESSRTFLRVLAGTAVCAALAAHSARAGHDAGCLTDNRVNPVFPNRLPAAQWSFASPSNTLLVGGWNASNRVDVGLGNERIVAAVPADMDRDGHLDLLMGTDGGSNYLVTPSLALSNHPAFHVPPGMRCMAVGDVNNDGLLDVAFGYPTGSNVIMINQGGGTSFVACALGTLNRCTCRIAFGDFNRDGYLDILEVNDTIYRTFIYLNDRTGTNWHHSGMPVGDNIDATDACVADFSGDGWDDFVVVSGNEWSNFLYVNDGTGTNFTPVLLNPYGVTLGVAAGDLNGDAHPDIVEVNGLGGLGNGRDIVYIADASGTNFTIYDGVLNAGDESADVAIGDVNMDGCPDILVGIDDNVASALYINNGTGTAYTRYGVQDVAGVNAACIADWNEDGANDLLLLPSAGGAAPYGNTIPTLGAAEQQGWYQVVVEDIGLLGHTEVWTSGMLSGAFHGVWNSGVILSGLTHSSEYAWRVQTISTASGTGAFSALNRFTWRMSNDYCEFVRMPELLSMGNAGSTQNCIVAGMSSSSITSLWLTNVTSGAALRIVPATGWAVTNLPSAFLRDVTNELHAVGRTALGGVASDVLTVVLTNRGIVNMSPATTNVSALGLIWQAPLFVTSTNWLSVRLTTLWTNGIATNLWFVPASVTSTPVSLSMGTNKWQVTYLTPQGIAETSAEWSVVLDTGGIGNISPAPGTVTNMSSLNLTWRLPPFVVSTAWVSVRWDTIWTNGLATNYWFAPVGLTTTPVNLSIGTNKWQVAYATPRGIVETSAEWSVVLDTGGIGNISPATGTVTNMPSLNVTWRLPPFVVSTAWVSVHWDTIWTNGLATNYWFAPAGLTTTPVNLSIGTNKWQVAYATPRGIVETSAEWSVVLDPDRIVNIAPASGTWTNAPSLLLQWSLPPFVTATNWVSVRLEQMATNGVVTNFWRRPTSISNTVVQLALGSNVWQVSYATPQALTQTSASWVVFLDTNAPIADLTTPQNGGVVSTNHVAFRYRVFDTQPQGYAYAVSSGIARVDFFCRDATRSLSTTLYSWTEGTNVINEYSSCPLNPFADGAGFQWHLKVWDRAGNVLASATNVFDVSMQSIVPVMPPDLAWVNTTSTYFSWIMPDSWPPTVTMWLQINGLSWVPVPNVSNIVQTILPGTNTWRVRAIFPSGQSQTSVLQRVLLDTAPPIGILVYPASNRYVKAGTIEFAYQLAETNSIWRSEITAARFHFVAPGTDMWCAVPGIAELSATNVFLGFPYNPLSHETDLVNAWQLEITERAGNVATTDFAVFGIDATPPTVQVTSPNGGIDFTTNTWDLFVGGTVTDAHGTLETFAWSNRSQVATSTGPLPLAGDWSIHATNMNMVEGTNRLVFIASDQAGLGATDTFAAILDLSPPLITLLYPSVGTDRFARLPGRDFTLWGTVSDSYSPLASLAWTNMDILQGSTLPLSNIFQVAGKDLGLEFGVTNTFRLFASDVLGWQTSIEVRILLETDVSATNTIPILANWPVPLGPTQTGHVEFAAVTNEEYSLRYESSTGSIELAYCLATSDYVHFAFSLAPFSLPPGAAPYLRLVSLTSGRQSRMPDGRRFIIASDMAVDLDGKTPTEDPDGDFIYFKLNPRGAATAHVDGRSLVIRGMTEPATLTIKVKANGGNGNATIPYLETDGVLKALKAKSVSVDEIHVPGAISVSLKNGTLGYAHDRRARVVHGLDCTGATPDTGLKSLCALYLMGAVNAPASYKGAGISLMAEKGGEMNGVFVGDVFKSIVAPLISDTWVFATANGVCIRKIVADKYRDTTFDQSRPAPPLGVQCLFVAGMHSTSFWAEVAARGSFAGIVPAGTIGSMTSRDDDYDAITQTWSVPQATFFINTHAVSPPRPVKVKVPIWRGTGYWYVDGVLQDNYRGK